MELFLHLPFYNLHHFTTNILITLIMKKTYFTIALLVMGLSACTMDYVETGYI